MVNLEDVLHELAAAAAASPGFVELRFHHQAVRLLLVRDGETVVGSSSVRAGVHVRVLEGGVWGAAHAVEVSRGALAAAIARAAAGARAIAGGGRAVLSALLARRAGVLARGVATHPGLAELAAMSVDDKLAVLHTTVAAARAASSAVASAVARYRELVEYRAIVTSDGARAGYALARPDAVAMVTTVRDGDVVTHSHGAGIAGGWDALWQHPTMHDLAERTAAVAVDLLAAAPPDAGRAAIVLEPSLTGVLCHEAVGHLLEYDSIHAASIAHGARGHRLGSSQISVRDAGTPADTRAAGYLPFDDEGIVAREAVLVERGRIAGYLHDSASAALEDDVPTGNARSWSATDLPLTRMRNTYVVPGEATADELIGEIGDGYVFAGNGGGQAESNGHVAITASYGWRIRDGRRRELVRGTTLTGYADEILASIDGVSRDFAWGQSIELCDRGQAARCDAGGPHIRCRLEVCG